jgi:hypothetical protein
MSDIVLDDGTHESWVTVDAPVLNIKGSDLILEQSAYRTSKGGKFRRALVHDSNDGLTINFGRDYPGGVTVTDANVNLRAFSTLIDVTLPKDAAVGDLRLIDTVSLTPGPGGGFHVRPGPSTVTLWLCVDRVNQGGGNFVAKWAPIQLGSPVDGTE